MRARMWTSLAGFFLAAGCVSPASAPETATVSLAAVVDSCESTRLVAVPLAEGPAPVEAISAFLDAGGRPDQLAAQLYQRGWVTPGSAFVIADLDGDSDQDLVVGLNGQARLEATDAADVVVVWLCESGSYRPVAVAQRLPDHGPPELQQASDLTGDGVPEIVIVHPRCGAHTCFASYAVLQFRDGLWLDRFEGPTDDLPSPQWIVHRGDPGRPAEIEIVAGGIGSAGAGPYRLHSRTWSWDPARLAFVPASEWVEPPRYRLHLIHDADDAFARGEVASALAHYERAIIDQTLLDWPGPGNGREALVGYAAFRRVLAHLTDGDFAAARAEFEARLQSAEGAGAAYAPLAQALLDSAPQPGPAAGCAAVREMAEHMPEATLDPLNFGYANRTYTPDDLCPPG